MPSKHEKVFAALVQFGFLPRATKHADEIPPLFNSLGFSPKIAREIASHPLRGGQGYDALRVNATRHNLAIRSLSIAHPASYSHLSNLIIDEWDNIRHISKNRRSRARPAATKGSRRFAMTETNRMPVPNVHHRYVVSADIGQFYDSIYTHAIAWALVGRKTAKQNVFTKPAPWYNQLDKLVRFMKRNETTGIIIGPATSTVMGELVLGAIDDRLKGFQYSRFVDDYTAFCDSETEALDFLTALRVALADYNLALNPRKTRIRALPTSVTPKWIRELRRLTPRRFLTSSQEIEDILDEAIELIDEDIDTSALVWALRAAEPSFAALERRAAEKIRTRLLHLAARRAPVVPFLCRFYTQTDINASVDKASLKAILLSQLNEGRSDCALWVAYLLLSSDIPLGSKVIRALVSHGDALTLTLMGTSTSAPARRAAIAFATDLTSSKLDDYDRDRYWMLLYELYKRDEVTLGKYADKSFEILKREDVSFVDWKRRKLRPSEARMPRFQRPYLLVGGSGGSPD